MTVKTSGAKPLADVDALERALGFRPSDEFLAFAARNNGATPETNRFEVRPGIESGINQFIPVAEIPAERVRIENLPDGAYPIAWAEGGNYVFLSRQGEVFFWDHEVPEDIVRIATTFTEFMAQLAPFDIGSIELKLGQVRRAWIDPEFLKRIKR